MIGRVDELMPRIHMEHFTYAQVNGGSMSLEVAVDGSVATLRMSWHERRNALRPEDADEIIAALHSVSECGAVVLCGDQSAFCAGADLVRIRELAAGGEAVVRNTIYRSFQGMAKAVRSFPGVVIAAVDGPALGLGADLALVCDVCYVGVAGWIEQGWGRIGAIPGIGGGWITIRRGGLSAAWEFVMSQRRWNGPALERLGLAIATQGSAEECAMDRARWVTSYTPDISRAYKSLLSRSLEESYDVHLERCGNYQGRLASDPQHRQRTAEVLAAAKGAGATL